MITKLLSMALAVLDAVAALLIATCVVVLVMALMVVVFR